MKTLMTMVAALAISSASFAQKSECTFRSEQDSFTRNYDGIVRIACVDGGESVNIVNRSTGEVIDTVDFGGERFAARCRPEGKIVPTQPDRTRFLPPNLTNTEGEAEGEGEMTRTIGTRRFETINVRSTGGEPITTTTSTTTPFTPNDTKNTGSSRPRRGFPASAALGLPN